MNADAMILTPPRRWIKRHAWPLALAALLGGCAPLRDEHPLPRDLPTMHQIYNAHGERLGTGPGSLNGARGEAARAPAANEAAALAAYSRDAYNEIELLFPRLPNPSLVMYVDPHLTDAGYPIPGYSTAFPLYERVQYALPGEVPPPARQPIQIVPAPYPSVVAGAAMRVAPTADVGTRPTSPQLLPPSPGGSQ